MSNQKVSDEGEPIAPGGRWKLESVEVLSDRRVHRTDRRQTIYWDGRCVTILRGGKARRLLPFGVVLGPELRERDEAGVDDVHGLKWTDPLEVDEAGEDETEPDLECEFEDETEGGGSGAEPAAAAVETLAPSTTAEQAAPDADFRGEA